MKWLRAAVSWNNTLALWILIGNLSNYLLFESKNKYFVRIITKPCNVEETKSASAADELYILPVTTC